MFHKTYSIIVDLYFRLILFGHLIQSDQALHKTEIKNTSSKYIFKLGFESKFNLIMLFIWKKGKGNKIITLELL